MNNFNNYMALALAEAEKAFAADEVPVGAVIVDEKGNIIAAAHNQVERGKDATLHAEMLAIKSAMQATQKKILEDFDIYVTLEPCPMCAYALSLARIRRIYFAASDKKAGGIENGPGIFSKIKTNHSPEIYSGIMAAESEKLLKNFFKARRK